MSKLAFSKPAVLCNDGKGGGTDGSVVVRVTPWEERSEEGGGGGGGREEEEEGKV